MFQNYLKRKPQRTTLLLHNKCGKTNVLHGKLLFDTMSTFHPANRSHGTPTRSSTNQLWLRFLRSFANPYLALCPHRWGRPLPAPAPRMPRLSSYHPPRPRAHTPIYPTIPCPAPPPPKETLYELSQMSNFCHSARPLLSKVWPRACNGRGGGTMGEGVERLAWRFRSPPLSNKILVVQRK